MSNYDYKRLCPFKWFVLENFPFIEADFDALTNWQLFCKLGKEMNKIIDSLNKMGIAVENISDYFDNLDVQEEINNKLDEMAESGELGQIIADFIGKTMTIFDSIEELKLNESLQVGSRAKTLGFYKAGDFGGAEYEIVETAVADDKSIFQLANGLYAKIIPKAVINPQMFGAHGYKKSSYYGYDNTKEDSSEAMQYTVLYALTNKIQNIEYLGLAYNCSGNNPCGLPIQAVLHGETINFDGQNSSFFWDNLGNDGYCFFFYGYLARSNVKNMQINSVSPNNKGRVFSTHFGIENQTHWSNSNIFENIQVNMAETGNVNIVINMETDGTDSHDDLTYFLNVNARSYINYVYCNNSEAVKNTFENCSTNSHYEGSIDFNYDGVAVPLNINSHHFTFSENGNIIYKNNLDAINVVNIYITKSRYELKADNFKYCDILCGIVHIDSLYKYSSGIWDGSSTGTIGTKASLYLSNMKNAYANFELPSIFSIGQGNIIIENSSFQTESINTSVPLFTYEGYDRYGLMRNAGRFPVPIYIKNAIPQVSRFFTDFEINSQYYKYHENIQLVPSNGYIYIPNCDVVFEELKLKTNAPDTVTYRVSIVNNGGSYQYNKTGSFTDGVANVNSTDKLVCPQNAHFKSLIIKLLDGTTDVTANYKTFVELKYRNSFYSDEFALENSNWITK